jgi:transcription initiation factor TFIIB
MNIHLLDIQEGQEVHLIGFRSKQDPTNSHKYRFTHAVVVPLPPPPPIPLPDVVDVKINHVREIRKTKKNQRTSHSSSDKAKMWEIFDTDNHNEQEQEQTVPDNVALSSSSTAVFHKCESCNYILMIMEDGFPTCTNPSCGIIYKNILDYSPEWRYYGANDKNMADPTRCGNPINPLLMESSFGCKILGDNRSSYEMKKIRKWTEWQSTPHREKSLYEEFQFITIMAQNSGIPKIFIDYAMVIHKDISEQKMFRGMNRDGIKAASIYISCRLNQCPRTAHEIAEIFKLDKQSTTYGCSMAVNIFNNIERNMSPSQKTELATTTPSAFIERYCSRLNIPSEQAVLAKFIAKKVENNSIVCDNTPQSSAAGIVFFVSQICNLNITKVEIKNMCCVSEVTINKCYKKLDSIREQLVPKCILDKYT